MKRLLLCLLLAGSLVMGQDTLILKSGEQQLVRFIEVRENSAVIEIKGVGIYEFAQQAVPLRLIDRIILEDGTVAWADPTFDGGSEGAIVAEDSSQSVATEFYSESQTKSPAESFTMPKPPSIEKSIAIMADSHERIAKVIEERWLVEKIFIGVTLALWVWVMVSL